MLDLSHDAIFVRGLDGVIRYWNEGAVRLYGWTTDEARGRISHSLLQTRFPPLERSLDQLLPQTGYWEGELTHSRKDGAEVVVDSRQVLVRDADGNPEAILETNRDVTQRKQAEAARDVFLSILTHDLRTPLITIKGMAQLIRRHLRRMTSGGADPVEEQLGFVEAAVSQMDAMLRDLLDAARLEAGQSVELNRHETRLVELVRKVVDEQQRTTSGHHIRVANPDGEITGNWDGERLERAVANLLSNAIKYSPEGGDILVSVNREIGDSGWASVSVHDSGVGVSPSDLPHIFDRFFRSSNVRMRIGGYGIGLAGAKQLIEQHGGRIDVTSEEGVGSTFTIRLPL